MICSSVLYWLKKNCYVQISLISRASRRLSDRQLLSVNITWQAIYSAIFLHNAHQVMETRQAVNGQITRLKYKSLVENMTRSIFPFRNRVECSVHVVSFCQTSKHIESRLSPGLGWPISAPRYTLYYSHLFGSSVLDIWSIHPQVVGGLLSLAVCFVESIDSRSMLQGSQNCTISRSSPGSLWLVPFVLSIFSQVKRAPSSVGTIVRMIRYGFPLAFTFSPNLSIFLVMLSRWIFNVTVVVYIPSRSCSTSRRKGTRAMLPAGRVEGW